MLLKCIKTAADLLPSSDQAEALVLLHGLSETAAQDFFGLVAGHVQKVVAGVGHRQVVLLGCGGLDDDAQALHAVDGDAIAARQEYWRQETPQLWSILKQKMFASSKDFNDLAATSQLFLS